MEDAHNNRRALVLGLAAVACWSTVATAFKLALQEVDTYQLVFYATLTATLTLLLIVAATTGLRALQQEFRHHWRITLVAGLMNPVIYYLILFKAYEMLPAQVAQSINYTWSIVLTLMAIVFLKQRILAIDLIAAVVCYGGVVLIATQGDLSSFNQSNPLGIALALLSTVIWAGYWTLNIRDQRDPVVGLCMNFIVALPVTLLVCLYFSGLEVSLRGLAGTIYVGLMEMAIAFVFWSSALKLATNTSRISNLIFLSPFVSLVIISQVLGEEIYGTTIAGLVLIISGLLVQQWIHQRQG